MFTPLIPLALSAVIYNAMQLCFMVELRTLRRDICSAIRIRTYMYVSISDTRRRKLVIAAET